EPMGFQSKNVGIIMENQYSYSTQVEWTGERRGDLSAPHLPDLEVDAPPEFKGHEGRWTPEHLFVAAVNSCFMTTFLAIAENSKLQFVSFSTDAKGTLKKLDGRGFIMTEVLLRPKLLVNHARDVDRAGRILEKAEKSCLISNSIKTETKLEPEVSFVGE
ncbi:MAG TPA: OsmC family protein, partial [Pyrinomonadaceae bacterium]